LTGDLFESLEASGTDSAFFIDKLEKSIEKEKLSEHNSRPLILGARDTRAGREGCTLLHSAARIGNFQVAQYLLQQPETIVDARNNSSSLVTPLMLAVSMCIFDIAEILALAGANLHLQDRNGENVFHYLARTGSAKTLKKLVELGQASARDVQQLASTANCNRRFPEDLASNQLLKEVLCSYRMHGGYVSSSSSRRKTKGKRGVAFASTLTTSVTAAAATASSLSPSSGSPTNNTLPL